MTLDFFTIYGSPPIRYTFTNAEAAFQALKFPNQARQFGNLSGAEAFRLKSELSKNPKNIDKRYSGYGNNWQAMLAVLRAKYAIPQFREKLLDTGNAFLLEHNNTVGRDNVWSDNCDGQGSNWLGLQLMLIRD